EVHCEPPNNRLDKFKGALTVEGQTYALDNDKVLLRGCTLRNTEWCFGLIFGFLAGMCSILAVGNAIWEVREGSVFTGFLPRPPGVNAGFSAFLSFWSYVIILNTVVPISLYVSVEIIRLGNSFYIDWDRKMYYPKNDTPAQARTTTLNEELGQIKYIFSDKTGTLTQNVMTFNKCSINGKSYGELFDFSGQRVEITDKTQKVDFTWNHLADPKFVFHDHSLVEVVREGDPVAQAFFRLLALCHTVMPEEKIEGQLYYQAQSPDEGALVTAARNFGFVFRSRTPESIRIMEMGREVTYELLAVLDFNNVRKRMSVIASAVEDKLQDGVPQTIEQLAKADIKIWVLTGDKQETAENIGYSCNMLREEMKDIFVVSANTAEGTVICCRVTPLQKAQVVELVKRYKQAVTLAIGDGANDVSMIKAAHIGVGISGQEGMQAVLSSDYSFAQFRYLQRLLLVHGRWSYLRMCKFLRYFFYKNFTFTFVHFWYAFFCGFSAQLYYQAQSPDEGALVTAARNFGFVFRSRTPESIRIMEMGRELTYELLAVLDFNNVRKRMSVIACVAEGKLTLFCKGADTIIYERLHPACAKLKSTTTNHLNANISMDGKEERLDELYEEIEKDLMLLGASAVEDKLQDGVPQTIEQLAKADIKIWVLTGDKQETAENIGYSCNMLREEMKDIFVVSANTAEGKTRTVEDEKVNGEYALVINGHSLTVICCRVTPLQKAQVVELVKRYKQAVTLAIGDGANDVSMIKAAHIGVGISGQEGMQAVLSSDYSFAQFRYLQRLLLVHGRWSYLRMCKFLRYFFYKNFTFTFVHFWYAFFCGFSAQVCRSERLNTLYDVTNTKRQTWGCEPLCRPLSSVFVCVCVQDVTDRWSAQHPQLYSPGQLNLYFSKKAFVRCMMHSCYSSLILFFIPWAAMYDTVRDDGKDIVDYQSFALLAQTCLLVAVTIQLCLDTHYWTAVNQFFVWGSLSAYFAITFTLYSNGMFLIFTSTFPFIGTARNSLNQPNVWLTILLTSILCALPVVAYRFTLIQLWPTINDKKPRRTSSRRATPPLPHGAPDVPRTILC
ncbi:hypothetical protein CRUP_018303, partial [Coryphaenoides rupestris]